MQCLAVKSLQIGVPGAIDTLLSPATFTETVELPNCVYCIVLIWGRSIYLAILMNDLRPTNFQAPPPRFSATDTISMLSPQLKDISEESFLSPPFFSLSLVVCDQERKRLISEHNG